MYYAFIIRDGIVRWLCHDANKEIVEQKLKAKLFDWKIEIKEFPEFHINTTSYMLSVNFPDITIQICGKDW